MTESVIRAVRQIGPHFNPEVLRQTREDETFHCNVGERFARHGYVLLVPNYRLAPAGTRPAGPQSGLSYECPTAMVCRP